ncbi:MBL fold metallo-hydrolase [Vibrio parahaemolyticus]|uniref:ComEC/Rec2 family competence protein n=1 Tax=Vibrio pelagius TaxID=28169 RepID=UPI002808C4D0|nr:MBL fold metallo-hydrolase [Vibrio parahaemolyticus]ELA7145841.1 MBL fold metallo-hydrolase [Vibrio parahaemolyticus]ELI5414498.1 MBL fold metallo-hydrolase [Vibrio parahaemolyticus]ELI5417942.1 MBL fold metallo-hydrolase [Vibrio parahaemolyticus]ELI5423078.1 MBL fold metallo-hydrolase [Vibrio parahaemolyticus]
MKVTINEAGNGDCLLLQAGDTTVLVDGGTASSYDSWGKIVTSQKGLDCVIVTHIDSDHVNGIIKLLDLANLESFTIDRFLYNGAPQILGLKFSDSSEHEQDYELLAARHEQITEDTDVASSEGTSLSYLIEKLKLNVNDNAIHTSNTTRFSIGDLTFELIGPSVETLAELKDSWLDALSDDGISPKVISKSHAHAFEVYIDSLREEYLEEVSSFEDHTVSTLAEYDYEQDCSLANKSSLAFLVEDKNSKCLFLGDCHAETLLTWLDNKRIDVINVDAVKLSHHGSKRNINAEFVARVKTENYIISTNGKVHNHPDLETLAIIAKESPSKTKKIYINYSINHIPHCFLKELEGYSTYVYMNERELNI